ncbi:hypothetical protein DFS34DRAFT_667022, partial [Phlyctochytrium arcticum]
LIHEKLSFIRQSRNLLKFLDIERSHFLVLVSPCLVPQSRSCGDFEISCADPLGFLGVDGLTLGIGGWMHLRASDVCLVELLDVVLVIRKPGMENGLGAGKVCLFGIANCFVNGCFVDVVRVEGDLYTPPSGTQDFRPDGSLQAVVYHDGVRAFSRVPCSSSRFSSYSMLIAIVRLNRHASGKRGNPPEELQYFGGTWNPFRHKLQLPPSWSRDSAPIHPGSRRVVSPYHSVRQHCARGIC